MKVFGIFTLLVGFVLGNDDNIVQIDQGRVKGSTLKSRSGREFKAFQGIPFARPPIGDLRFQEPVPAGSWDGVLVATFEPQACLQHSLSIVLGSEDCLYLNVYTPEIPKNGDAKLLPVMFWIHGGAFTTGNGGISVYGPYYLLDKDVVVVTINYRLGALGLDKNDNGYTTDVVEKASVGGQMIGFLSTGDENLPGNNGLKDQVLALKWVKNNIGKFGGDPNGVTIFGESAGGASVSLHILSPMSKGLFHKAIMESGTALNSWAVTTPKETKRNVLFMSNVTGCPAAESQKFVECLRGLPARKLVDFNKNGLIWKSEIFLTPVVENCNNHGQSFLCENPLLNYKEESEIPVLIGMTSGEGGLFASYMYNATDLVDIELKNDFNKYMSKLMRYAYTAKSSDVSEIGRKIFERYYPDGSLEDPSKTVKLFTDGIFLNGIFNMAIKTSPPAYYYMYDHSNQMSLNRIYGRYPHPSKLGVTHGDELLSLFHIRLFGDLKGDDLEVSKTMVNLWTRFATSNEITTDGTSGGEKWPAFDHDSMKYLLINSSKPVILEKPYAADYAFWNDLPLLSGLKSHE